MKESDNRIHQFTAEHNENEELRPQKQKRYKQKTNKNKKLDNLIDESLSFQTKWN